MDDNSTQEQGIPVPDECTEQAVRAFLLDYAWSGTADEQRRAVGCIMAQNDWRLIATLADKFAGAQEEPGPVAFAEGVLFALTGLYECHDDPHLPDCPLARSGPDDEGSTGN